jgi:hypothetical protein
MTATESTIIILYEKIVDKMTLNKMNVNEKIVDKKDC